jgi:hypothetical protein
MSPAKELSTLLERLNVKDRDLAVEIQLVTAWIKEHRETRPDCIEVSMASADERNEYYSWRKVSCQLHQRRSELKTKREQVQMHIRTVLKKIDKLKTDFSDFPVFSNTGFDLKLVSAGA